MDSYNPTTVSPSPMFETAMDAIDGQSPTVELSNIDTHVGEARPADQHEMYRRGRSRARREAGEQMFFGPQRRFASPEARFVCDGWCKYSEEPHPNVVSIEHLLLENSGPHVCRQLSLSACSDSQRVWEGPRDSLTMVLCNYLSKCIFHCPHIKI
jgi:hypothetical protein